MASPISGLARSASIVPTLSATALEAVDRPPVKIVQRGNDILTVVRTQALSESAESLNTQALEHPEMPRYTPDGAGAILVFHTEKGTFVLGGMRDNPALSGEKTKDGTSFPRQLSTTVGGYLADPQQAFRQSVLQSIRTRFLLNDEQTQQYEDPSLFPSWQLLENVCHTIDNDQGWGDRVCVHTDRWKNADNTEGTMCYMTAVKHFHAGFAQLAEVEDALGKLVAHQAAQGKAPRVKMEFKFVPFDPVVENSLASYRDDEITKARTAYDHFQDKVVVTFNDLAMATLAENQALQQTRYASLTLPRHGSDMPDAADGPPIQTLREAPISARTRALEVSKIVERFTWNRQHILSDINLGTVPTPNDAVFNFINGCHYCMLQVIELSGNLNAAKVILASARKAIIQIDELYCTVHPSVKDKLMAFPPNLAARWKEAESGII
jgi:hypothetical protein